MMEMRYPCCRSSVGRECAAARGFLRLLLLVCVCVCVCVCDGGFEIVNKQ